jgi:hypothetical protein
MSVAYSRKTNPRRASRLTFAFAFTLASALALAGCSISVGDQSCTESSNPNNKDDACPYGPPGGPKVKPLSCPLIPVDKVAPGCDVSSFAPIFEMFTDESRGNCSNTGCHGADPGARGIHLPDDNPTAMYDELKGYTGSQGYPYINEEEPSRSWILCNLSGIAGGGSPMPPPSGLSQSDFEVINTWAMCGLPREALGDGGP